MAIAPPYMASLRVKEQLVRAAEPDWMNSAPPLPAQSGMVDRMCGISELVEVMLGHVGPCHPYQAVMHEQRNHTCSNRPSGCNLAAHTHQTRCSAKRC